MSSIHSKKPGIVNFVSQRLQRGTFFHTSSSVISSTKLSCLFKYLMKSSPSSPCSSLWVGSCNADMFWSKATSVVFTLLDNSLFGGCFDSSRVCVFGTVSWASNFDLSKARFWVMRAILFVIKWVSVRTVFCTLVNGLGSAWKQTFWSHHFHWGIKHFGRFWARFREANWLTCIVLVSNHK